MSFFLILWNYSYATEEEDQNQVKTRILQIQNTDPLLPTSETEQKWQVGTIFEKMFNANGKIKKIFLETIYTGLTWSKLVIYDDTLKTFTPSSISDNGTNIWIGWPVSSNGTLAVTWNASIWEDVTGSSNTTLTVDTHPSANANTRQIQSVVTATSPTLTADRTTYWAQFSLINNKTENIGAWFDSDANGVYSYVETSGTNTFRYNRWVYGLSYNQSTATSGLGTMYWVQGSAWQLANSGNIASIFGVHGTARWDTTASTTSSITSAYGNYGTVSPYRSNVTHAYGVMWSVRTNNSYGWDVTNAYGIYADVHDDSDDGWQITTWRGWYFTTRRRASWNLMTTAYGIQADANGATTVYGMRIDADDPDATSNYWLWIDAKNGGTTNYGILWEAWDWLLQEDGNGWMWGTWFWWDFAIWAWSDLRMWHDGTNSYIRNHTGDLYIGDNGTDNLVLSNNGGSVWVGDPSPDTGLKVDIEGRVWATEYCDEDWLNCHTIEGLSNNSSIWEDDTSVWNWVRLQWDNVDARIYSINPSCPWCRWDLEMLRARWTLWSEERVLNTDALWSIRYRWYDGDEYMTVWTIAVRTTADSVDNSIPNKMMFAVSDTDHYSSTDLANATRMTILSNWNIGIWDDTPDSGLKLDVEWQVGASEYCDEDGNNCHTISALASNSSVWENDGTKIKLVWNNKDIRIYSYWSGWNKADVELMMSRWSETGRLKVESWDVLWWYRFRWWDGDEYLTTAWVFAKVSWTTWDNNIDTRLSFVVDDDDTYSSDAPERMVIDHDGNVGIWDITPDYRLDVVWTAGKTSGGSWSNSSDIRLKDISWRYEYGLAEINQLRPIRFTYKEDNARDLPSDEAQIWFVAQEVEKVIPDAVTEGEDGYLDFNIHSVNVALVNAVKEQQTQIEELQKQVELLLNQK